MPSLKPVKLEMQVIKSITSNSRSASVLLPALNEDSFDYEPAKQAYDRISRILIADGTVPSWVELINDPVLDEDVRAQLSKFKQPIFTGKDRCKRVAAKIDQYRQLRIVVRTMEETFKAVQKTAVDPKLLMDRIGDQIAKARSLTSQEDMMLHIGQGRKFMRKVKSLLRDEANIYVPTGFKAFDERNRGIGRGNLWLLAATTGGGKSMMALQIARNMAESGARVCIVSLEMSDDEMIQRRMSAAAQVSLTEIISPSKMSHKRRNACYRRVRQYHRNIKKRGGLETYMVPEGDLDIKEILYTLKPYKYDAIVIDYIGLLGGMDGDNQWRELSAAARFGKRFGASNDTIIALCAQLSEELVVRYSRGIKEHANNMWAWSYNGEDGPGIVEIRQQKARNQSPFPFNLYFEPEYMTVRDCNEEENAEADEVEEVKTTGFRQKKFQKKGLGNKRTESDYATI